MSLTGRLKKAAGELNPVAHPGNLVPGVGDSALAARVARDLTASGSDLRSIAHAAGFRGGGLEVAVAVALAESGGKVNAEHTNTDGSVDRGLWQINSVHSQYDAAKLTSDPAYNAQAAFEISNGGRNWSPWTTFQSGAYRKFLGKNKAVDTGDLLGKVPVVGGALDSAENAVSDTAGFIAKVTSPVGLGQLLASAFAVFFRFFFQALWKYALAPPWHRTQKASVFYAETVLDGKRMGVDNDRYKWALPATIAFWAFGWTALFSRTEEGFSPLSSARRTPLGKTIRKGQGLAARRKLIKAKDVQKKTPKKPKVHASRARIAVVRNISVDRPRSVTVRERGTNGDQAATTNGTAATGTPEGGTEGRAETAHPAPAANGTTGNDSQGTSGKHANGTPVQDSGGDGGADKP